MPNMPGYQAGGDINPSRFITLDDGVGTPSRDTAWEANAGSIPFGVSQEGPKDSAGTLAAEAGDQLKAYFAPETAYLELSGTVDVGEFIVADAGGTGIAAPTTGTANSYIGARALAPGVSGDIVLVQVLYAVERPALT